MKFQLYITCDNDAFSEDPTREVARILSALAERLTGASPDESYPLRDANGNTVGRVEFRPDDPLRDALRLVVELSGNVAHGYLNPVSAVETIHKAASAALAKAGR